MKKGDLVTVWKRYHWGGLANPVGRGILIKRTYLGYEKGDSHWLVMMESGKAEVIKEKNLDILSRANEKAV